MLWVNPLHLLNSHSNVPCCTELLKYFFQKAARIKFILINPSLSWNINSLELNRAGAKSLEKRNCNKYSTAGAEDQPSPALKANKQWKMCNYCAQTHTKKKKNQTQIPAAQKSSWEDFRRRWVKIRPKKADLGCQRKEQCPNFLAQGSGKNPKKGEEILELFPQLPKFLPWLGEIRGKKIEIFLCLQGALQGFLQVQNSNPMGIPRALSGV